jgi:hypothetical protein
MKDMSYCSPNCRQFDQHDNVLVQAKEEIQEANHKDQSTSHKSLD